MPGNPLVRFDEGRVGRTARCRPLSYSTEKQAFDLQVFHEEDGVTAFVVEEFVDEVLGEEDAEAAWALAFFGADFDVADGGILGIGDSRVGEEVQGESDAGVGDVDDDGAGGAEQGGTDALAGVVLAAVLDGVHEQFAEGGGDVLGGLLGEIGLNFTEEVGGAVGGIDLTADVERDPLGAGGDDTDIVLPGLGLEGVLHHLDQGGGREGAMEVTENTLADGLNNLLRVGLAGKDHLGLGADGADAAQEFQGVEAVGAGASEQNVEGTVADPIKGFAAIRYVLYLTVILFEEAGQMVLNRRIGIEQQQAAGVQKISTL